jgi:peptide/nickel transport system ATP-binding protein
LNEYPHQLSGGMRQRVTIAIAISCNPKLLLADEPTTALDVTVQKQILDLLEAQQSERNMGMILVTHDLGVVAGRSDFTMVMYAGQPVEYAPTGVLFSEMRHPYTEALLKSIPRISNPPHSKLMAISGRPPDLVNPPAGCRFAARCRYAQERCLEEDPEVTTLQPDSHRYRCFYPVGTSAAEEAIAVNVRRGRTAAGLVVEIER